MIIVDPVFPDLSYKVGYSLVLFSFSAYTPVCAVLYGSKKGAFDYVKWVKDDKLFDMLVQRLSSSAGHAFPRLKLHNNPSL